MIQHNSSFSVSNSSCKMDFTCEYTYIIRTQCVGLIVSQVPLILKMCVQNLIGREKGVLNCELLRNIKKSDTS